jgi:cobalt-zinc-cadmium resistance protein CzcA
MIERIVNLSFARRGVVWLIFIFAALYGGFSWKQLPLEAYPDIADVTSQIVTQVPGLAAEEIEQQITIPLERALLATPAMHVLRSRSLFGLSLITVVFEDGVDGYWARQRLKERMDEVDLPYGARRARPTARPRARSTAIRWKVPRTACASCPSCSSGW